MQVTLKELKIQPGRVLSMAEEGAEVIVTVRGIPRAKIVPLKALTSRAAPDTSAFGMWADRSDIEDVDGFVKELRQGRRL